VCASNFIDLFLTIYTPTLLRDKVTIRPMLYAQHLIVWGVQGHKDCRL